LWFQLYQQRACYNPDTHPPVIVAQTRRLNGIYNELEQCINSESEHLRTKVKKNGGQGWVTEGIVCRNYYVFLLSEKAKTYYITYLYIKDKEGNLVGIPK